MEANQGIRGLLRGLRTSAAYPTVCQQNVCQVCKFSRRSHRTVLCHFRPLRSRRSMGRAVEALFSSACPLPGGTLLVRNDETADAGEAPSGPMVLTSDASVQLPPLIFTAHPMPSRLLPFLPTSTSLLLAPSLLITQQPLSQAPSLPSTPFSATVTPLPRPLLATSLVIHLAPPLTLSLARSLLLNTTVQVGGTVYLLPSSPSVTPLFPSSATSAASTAGAISILRAVPFNASVVTIGARTTITLGSPPTPPTPPGRSESQAGAPPPRAAEGGGPSFSAASLTALETLYHMAKVTASGTGPAVLMPRGMLLHGPPGVGKTFAVREVARRLGEADGFRVQVVVVNGAEGMEGGGAEGAKKVRTLWADARDRCKPQGECDLVIVFLDEVDALKSREDAGGDLVVQQLATLLDDAPTRLMVVAASNQADQVPKALRRPGRLEKELLLTPPDVDQREALLRQMLSKIPAAAAVLEDQEGFRELARVCVGYVAADLAALVREAAMEAMRESQRPGEHSSSEGNATATVGGSTSGTTIQTAHLRRAMEKVGPSVLRGQGLEAPTVKWSDIGGQAEAKLRLQQCVEWPLRYPDTLKRFNLSTPSRGVLLYGPPGCSKTTLVKAAVAASKGASFLSLSSGDVYSPYVGDAEAAVRRAFATARQAAPCVLFFDEIDAIVGGGAGGRREGTAAESRVLATFLNELDGVDVVGWDGVLVVGATNCPEALDPALTRPGRLSTLVHVPPPSSVEDREAVLAVHFRKVPLDEQGVDLRSIAERTQGFSGADLQGLAREAAMAALRENRSAAKVQARHVEAALQSVKPSLPFESMTAAPSLFL